MILYAADRAFPVFRLFGQLFAFFRWVIQGPYGAFAGRGQEPDDRHEGRSNGPRRLPTLGMMAGNAKADLLVNLEPTGGRQQDD